MSQISGRLSVVGKDRRARGLERADDGSKSKQVEFVN